MCSFVTLNCLELLDRDLHIAKSGSCEVGRLEFSKCLSIKLCLQLFQHIRKFCIPNKLSSLLPKRNEDVLSTKRSVGFAARLTGSAEHKKGAARAMKVAEKRIVNLETVLSKQNRTCWRTSGTLERREGPGALPGSPKRNYSEAERHSEKLSRT